MSIPIPQKTSLKQKAAHEFREIATISLYLAFFFCALATYSMLLLGQFHISYFAYGAALINALVITKVILIGEAVDVGDKFESRPLFYSAIYKAFLYSLLVLAFHFLEEIIKRLVHGKDIAGAFHEIRLDELIARSVVVFCTFIPLFGFREMRRVLGEVKFRTLLFHDGTTQESNQSSAT
jgi:CRISPR/Cas system-associated protein endoribonuclease Cas2